MAAKSIPRKRLFWISNIATSDTTRFRRLPLPPEVELHKEILRLTDLLHAIHDEEGRRERRRELGYKLMKFRLPRFVSCR
jgi:hypothetical protein